MGGGEPPLGEGRAAAPLAGLGDGTRVIHAGLDAPRQHEPLLPGPQFASLYHLSGEPTGHPLEYGRYGNPTWARWEAALGELEGGQVVSFASGMAAVAAVLVPRLSAGDVLLLPSDGYPSVRDLARSLQGVEVRTAPTTEFGRALDGATFVWLESPSNPGLEVCDVAAICSAAHAQGALVAVDNTLATPIGQRPLSMGADFSVASDSKHASGHSDLILGHVAVSDPELAASLGAWRRMTGAVPGPFEAWLAHRSLATLDVRLERQCATALKLASMLAARPDVTAVRYPGLADDPSHELAARQMTRFGSIVAFDVGARERAERFLAACRLVAEATSFGGVHSTAERRARWSGNEVGEGFIRFSVGCETAADLIADVERALDESMG
ncbi:MAG: cystathionine gamma-lyase [Thermoleophilaceae bacterium]|nr:cystathionine gamma-lyase [Thermoleophilaceae bacterium]MEA2429492.1 cystathionine gamma-lyase [Thermoleophilaceae bacterium]MEA2470952.1 cystathionine gamma-lyase [Thermoleophilaceae bacterium]